MSTHTHMSMKLGKLKSKNSSSGAVGGGSLRLRLPSSLQSASSSSQTVDIALPRNSFTETDYYRATKHEIHSPVSFATLYGPRAEEDTRRATTSRIYLNRAETFDLEEEDNDAEREDYEEQDCEEGDDAEATADGKKKRALAGAVPLASVEAGNGSSKRPRKLSSLLQTLRDSMLRKLPDRRWASLRQRRATTDTTHEQRKRAVPRSKSMPAF